MRDERGKQVAFYFVFLILAEDDRMLAIIMAMNDDGDRSFVEDIYNRYAEKMYLVAMDILHDHFDAQDCVQETIVKVIDKIEIFMEAARDDDLAKMLLITCRNTARAMYDSKIERKTKEFSISPTDDEDSPIFDIPDESSNVEEAVMSEMMCDYLNKLISSLDEKYRDVMILRSMGLACDEIAYLMDISPSLVRKRYSRAKAKILELGGESLRELVRNR